MPMLLHLPIAYAWSLVIKAEFSCDREHMAHKAEDVCSLQIGELR